MRIGPGSVLDSHQTRRQPVVRVSTRVRSSPQELEKEFDSADSHQEGSEKELNSPQARPIGLISRAEDDIGLSPATVPPSVRTTLSKHSFPANAGPRRPAPSPHFENAEPSSSS